MPKKKPALIGQQVKRSRAKRQLEMEKKRARKLEQSGISNRKQVRTWEKPTNDTRQCPAVSPIDNNGDQNSASSILEQEKSTQCNENNNMMNTQCNENDDMMNTQCNENDNMMNTQCNENDNMMNTQCNKNDNMMNTQCNEINNMMNTLADDLQAIVQYLWKGFVSVSLGTMPGENVWTIQGPKKNITVRVHYRNDCERLPTDEDEFISSGNVKPVSIKQELGEDLTLFNLTNSSFEQPSISTRVAETVESNTIDSTCRCSHVEPVSIKQELDEDSMMFDLTNGSFEQPSISTHVAETVKPNTIDPTRRRSQRFVSQPSIRRRMPREASLPISNFVHVQGLESSTNDEFILPDLGDNRHIPSNILLDRIKSEPCADEITVNAECRNLHDNVDSWHHVSGALSLPNYSDAKSTS